MHFVRKLFGVIVIAAFGISPVLAQATRFIVSEAGGTDPLETTAAIQAGVDLNIRVTAVDAAGDPVVGYARDVTVTLPDPFVDVSSATVTIPAASFVDGVADNVVITPIYSGTVDRRVAVTDGNIATYNANFDALGVPTAFSVAPARFIVRQIGSSRPLAASPILTGLSTGIRVYALNFDGTIATGYTGTVTLESTALAGPEDITISFGGQVDAFISFANAADDQTISATDGVTLTDDASGDFDVFNFTPVSGIEPPGTPKFDPGATLRPGDTVEIEYELKSSDLELDSGDPAGTFSTLTLFNGNRSIVIPYVIRSAQKTPPSDAEDGAIAIGTYVIPDFLPPGNYTLRMNAGGVGRNVDTTITIGGLPDLVINNFNYPGGNFGAGEAVRFDMSWYNAVYSPGSNERNALLQTRAGDLYRVEIHLSTNEDFGDFDDVLVWTDTFIGNTQGAVLLPNQGVSITGEFKLPANLSGTYYLLAKINSSGGRNDDDPAAGFSSGFAEQFGPATSGTFYYGNNIIIALETQKITITPRSSSETTRVSTDLFGLQSVGNSDQAVVSRDGTYTAFQSLAPLAGTGSSNGFNQIFRKGTTAGDVALVSIATNGGPANGHSTRPAMSADGRYVAFESSASNLVPGDQNGFSDIFVRAVQEGITRRISINGFVEANNGSFKPSISADGRFIAFASRATNLVSGASAGLNQIYLYDRDVSGSGVFDTAGNTVITLVSSNAGVAGTEESSSPRVSPDGNYVVFTTKAKNLHGNATNPFGQIVRWERATGALVSVSASLYGTVGDLADGNSDYPTISKTQTDDLGRVISYVVFISRALNLTDHAVDTYASGIPHVFRATIADGVVEAVIRINGAGNREPDNSFELAPDLGNFEPSISEDGNLIVFATESSNLQGPIPVNHIDRTTYLSEDVHNYFDSNMVADVYLADLTDPAAPIIQRASISSFGYEVTPWTTGTGYTTRIPSSRAPSISPDGRYIVFTSDAEGHNGLVFGSTNFDYVDFNSSRDIYMLDRKKVGSSVPINLPSITLFLPPALTVTPGNTVSLTALAGSQSRGIAAVEFYANNLLIGSVATPTIADSGVFQLNWTAPSSGNGNSQGLVYELTAVAVDTSGVRSLVSNVSRITVSVPNTSSVPTITLVGLPSAELVRAGSSVLLTAFTSDLDRNLTGVEFFVNGASVGNITRGLAPGQTSDFYTVSWTNAGPGYYTVIAQARDASGNRVVSTPLIIQVYPVVNAGIPSVSLTTPAADLTLHLGSSLRLVAAANDPGGEVDRVDFYANGTLVATADAAPYEGVFAPATVGIYNLYAIVVDNDGNQSVTPEIVTVTVDSEIDPVLGVATNDLFVYQVLLDGDQHIEMDPGDPIRYTVAYGRNIARPNETHERQRFRVSVYLSTDGDPDNDNNFLLDFFDSEYPRETTGRFELNTLVNRLPSNFTGTYFLFATVRVSDGANDGNDANDSPIVFLTGTARVTIRPVDSPTVSRVTNDVTGTDANEFSESGVMSADGRYIVFQSEATDLVSAPVAPAGVSQIYLRDTLTGLTTLISQRGGVAGNAESKYASITTLGSQKKYYIVYQSAATNLIGGNGNTDTNQQTDIFLYEVATGITSRISVPSGAAFGQQANGGSFLPVISGNGDYVVFESDATNLVASGSVPDTNNKRDIYLYERSTKAVRAISTTITGVFGNGASTQAQISEDGSTVVFRSYGNNLAGGKLVSSFPRSVIYAKTLATGIINPISVIRENVGAGALTYAGFNADAFDPVVSANGRYVAFASRATNIPSADGLFNTLGQSQVYMVNRAVSAGAVVATSSFDQVGDVSLVLISASADPVTGEQAFADQDSLAPVISGNGRYVGYRTEASNLLPEIVIRSDGEIFASTDVSGFEDTNNTSDVYIRDTGIAAISVMAPGSGYPESAGIEVSITGGGGTGARALAVIENGQVSRVDILDAGSGYTSTPTVTIPAQGVTQATAAAILTFSSDRVSVSHFGQQTIGVIGSFTVPSSRDLSMTSDGRYLLFTSDAHNSAGFIFGKSNQLPLDGNSKRDIFLVDRKVGSYITPVAGTAPTVSISLDSRPASFGSSRVVQAEAFDAGDVDDTGTAVSGVLVSLELYANNALLRKYTPTELSSRGTTSSPWLAPLTAGPVQFYAIAEDANGNRTRSAPINVTVSSPPSLEPSITLQASATTLSIGQTMTLTATASDPDNGVKAVRFYANGVAIGRDLDAPYTLAYTPSVSGPVEFLALVYDNNTGGDLDLPPEIDVLRNTELSNAVNALVLAPAVPTVTLVSPAAALSTTVGAQVFIEASAESNNPNATISNVEIRANDVSIGVAERISFTSSYRLNWTPTVPGVYSISARATDSQQVSASSSTRTVTVNAVVGSAPVVVISSPTVDIASGYALVPTNTTTTVQMQAVDADGSISYVDLYLSGRRLGRATASGANFSYILDGTAIASGLYDLVALAADSSGNIAVSTRLPILVAAPPASVQILAPLPVAPSTLVDVKRGQPVVFLLNAQSPDALVRISEVSMLVNGERLPVVATARGTGGEYTFIWTPTVTGIFTVVASATDSAGGTVRSSDVNVRVTEPVGTPPAVSLVSPQAPASTDANTVTRFQVSNQSRFVLGAAAVDSDGSITSVEFLVGGKVVASLTAEPYTTIFSTSSLAPGDYPIQVIATDNNGNKTLSDTVNLRVTAAVAVGLTNLNLDVSPVTRRGETVNFTVTGSHTFGSIASVLFLANGFPFENAPATDDPNPVTSAPFSTSRTIARAGVVSFSALVTDNFGNTDVTNTVVRTIVANNPPTVRITYPLVNNSTITFGNTISLEAEAIAPDAGDIITDVSFFANGAEISPTVGTVTQVAGTNRWRFAWTPTVVGTYEITAEAVTRGGTQQSAGNNPLVATSASVTLTVNGIASSEASAAISLAYQLVFDREPTTAEIVAAVAKFGEDVTTVELITDLLVSSTYRDGEAELLLYHLAVFGRYPTPTEFAALRALLTVDEEGEEALTDIAIVDSLLRSSAYSTLYGDIDDLSVVSTSQYELIRDFALRTYANINGKSITGTSASVLAQNFFSSIAGYRRGTVLVPGITPAETLVNYIASVYKAGKNTTLLAKLRVAGALLFIENEEPDRTSVDTLAPYPLVAVVQQLLAGEIFYVAGSFVEIPTASGDEPVGTTFYISGLPKTLVVDKNTGVITGQLPASIKIYSFKVWTQSSTGVRSAVSQRLLVAGALSSKFAGGVEAILHDESGDVVGKVSYKVSTSASYTGKLMYRDGKTYSFKGVLGVQGTDPETATAVGVNSALIKRASPLLPLELGIAYAEDGAVTLWVAEGAGTDPVATATEEDVIKTTTYTKSAPAPWRGVTKVNLVTEGDLFPAGSGSGTLSVATTGVLSVRIRGGDNALITGTANSSATSQYRFYTRPYSKKPAGYFAGSLTLSDEETPATVDFPETDFTWFRPAGLAPYPEGFGPISVSLELTE